MSAWLASTSRVPSMAESVATLPKFTECDPIREADIELAFALQEDEIRLQKLALDDLAFAVQLDRQQNGVRGAAAAPFAGLHAAFDLPDLRSQRRDEQDWSSPGLGAARPVEAFDVVNDPDAVLAAQLAALDQQILTDYDLARRLSGLGGSADGERQFEADREMALRVSGQRPPPGPSRGLPLPPPPPRASTSSVKLPSVLRRNPRSDVAPKGPSNPPPAGSDDCAVCLETIPRGRGYTAPCNHNYDFDCLARLMMAAAEDESVFPPRCCGQDIPFAAVRKLKVLSKHDVSLFESRALEYSTPNRVYCLNGKCARFLGAATDTRSEVTCPACGTRVCRACKFRAHPHGVCTPDDGDPTFLDAARRNAYAKCPTCSKYVERDGGCRHMVCRCGTQFCYKCSRVWKTCHC